MNKNLILVLLIVVLFSFAACGDSSDGSGDKACNVKYNTEKADKYLEKSQKYRVKRDTYPTTDKYWAKYDEKVQKYLEKSNYYRYKCQGNTNPDGGHSQQNFGWCKPALEASWLLQSCSEHCLWRRPGDCPTGYENSYVFAVMHCGNADYSQTCGEQHKTNPDPVNCPDPSHPSSRGEPWGWCRKQAQAPSHGSNWILESCGDCFWGQPSQCPSGYFHDTVYDEMHCGDWETKCPGTWGWCKRTDSWLLPDCTSNNCLWRECGNCPQGFSSAVLDEMNCGDWMTTCKRQNCS